MTDTKIDTSTGTSTGTGTGTGSGEIHYTYHCADVNWAQLRLDLIDDNFHNGRSTEQLQASFVNSRHCVMALAKRRCIGTARALSDGIGNAYIVDMWTHSIFRGSGIGTELMNHLLSKLQGQHLYLQTDDAVEFYQKLGFKPQPEGLYKVVGDYLGNPRPE